MRLASAFIVLPMMVYFLVRHSPQKKFPIIQAVMDDLKAERGELQPAADMQVRPSAKL